MSWRLLVIRKDSPVRMFNVAMQRSTRDLNFVGSPYLESSRFDKFVIDSHGAYHVDVDQMMGLMTALIKTSKEHPGYFAQIAERYLNLGAGLLSWLGEINRLSFPSLTSERLLDLFSEFCERYVEYAPILFVPFAAERRYMTEYPALLKKMAGQLSARWDEEVGRNHLLSFIAYDILEFKADESSLVKGIKSIVEHSVRRTMAEEKEIALLKAAASMGATPEIAALFSGEHAPTLGALYSVAPAAAGLVDGIVREHGWIKQWGYPPFYTASTAEDIIAEIKDKMTHEPGSALVKLHAEEERAKRDYALLLDTLNLEPHERELIEDLNLYNFLRTYRMEVKIKAQYLSVPLLREIERRAIAEGKLKQPDDIFFLAPPEIKEMLKTGFVPAHYPERRDGWVLVVDGDNHQMLSGAEYEAFRDGFYGVIDCRSNARSTNSVDAKYVGGKAKSLFTLFEHGFRVPKFFVVTTHAYRNFMKDNKLDLKIRAILAERGMRGGGNEGKSVEDYEAISKQIRSLFAGGSLRDGLVRAVRDYYGNLGLSEVAVRSSATTEDAENLSWAGRFSSVVYVQGDRILDTLKEVWSSLFTPAALQYALANDTDPAEMEMAVIVQEMIDPERSGVVNTTLSSKNSDLMEIEVAIGQGSPVVSGEVTPDRFIVSKKAPHEVVDRTISTQSRKVGRSGWEPVESDRQSAQKLDDPSVTELAKVCLEVEALFESPQDIEYAYAGGELFVLQSRPETGLQVLADERPDATAVEGKLILTGQHGKVESVLRARAKVLHSPAEADKLERGEILVLHGATPAWDPIIFKSAGIICNEGGSTSHAIRVANERGLPAVVGIGNATKVIKDGNMVVMDTRDSFKGKVYKVEAK
jgi:phosphohistidine swiveling domain-containing protein